MRCPCSQPPFHTKDFEVAQLGTDATAGRFAEVTLERCLRCGGLWLHYLIELEAFSHSGRWYRCAVSEDQAKTLTPENASSVLSSVAWHFYGGSYYESTGMRAIGGANLGS